MGGGRRGLAGKMEDETMDQIVALVTGGRERKRERERERERERGKKEREREEERAGEERVYLESIASVYAAPSSASPAEQSAACYKPSYTRLLGGREWTK